MWSVTLAGLSIINPAGLHYFWLPMTQWRYYSTQKPTSHTSLTLHSGWPFLNSKTVLLAENARPVLSPISSQSLLCFYLCINSSIVFWVVEERPCRVISSFLFGPNSSALTKSNSVSLRGFQTCTILVMSCLLTCPFPAVSKNALLCTRTALLRKRSREAINIKSSNVHCLSRLTLFFAFKRGQPECITNQ